MSAESDLRPSPIAGRWYPGDPTDLTGEVSDFLQQAKFEESPAEVIGLIVPHAGHRYSGRTAGYAFRTVMGKRFEIVAVVSPFHDFHPAEVLVSGHQAYTTPLGPVSIDPHILDAFSRELAEAGGPAPQEIVYDQEHSLEIELPFLQVALTGEFQLLPVMIRGHSKDVCHSVGKALAGALRGRSALLVASSDLSHFYPETRAKQLDQEMLNLISSFMPESVLTADANRTSFACGAGAIASVLWAARELGADQVKILHHSTSAEETGDHNSVVGYGSAVILKNP